MELDRGSGPPARGVVMGNNVAIIIVAAIVVIGAIFAVSLMARRRTSRHLHDQFGPEYDHMVQEVGDRGRAERELVKRDKRVKRLTIRPLAPSERSRYVELWHAQQARFVD